MNFSQEQSIFVRKNVKHWRKSDFFVGKDVQNVKKYRKITKISFRMQKQQKSIEKFNEPSNAQHMRVWL